MHSALQIPEILDQIISHLEKDDQKRCTPVCQLWSEVALDHIWRRIVYYSNLKKLSSAAKEINTERPASHTSNSPLTVKALNRLKLKYYARIRTLDLGYSGSWVVLRELMSNSGLTSTLFPNLQCLDCQDQIFDEEFSILILHSGIKSFSVWCSDGLSDILHLTQTIQTRMPNLTSLSIFLHPHQEYAGPLATLLENLTSLEHAEIPPFKDISPILWSLSRARKVQKLGVYMRYGRRVSRAAVDDTWSEEDGPSLEELTVPVVKCETIIPLLLRLHLLRVLELFVAQSSDRKCLFDALSHCPVLTKLSLTFTWEPRRLEFDDLHGILACRNLAEISLRSRFNLSDSDLAQMALAWPWLQQLKLECLGQNGPGHTSLWAVFAFTRLCPHLAYLKLSIDTAPLDTPPFIASSLPTQAEIAQAAALETLDFGYDPMRLGYDDEFVLAELLGKILPPRCSLLWEFSSDYDEDRLEDQLEDDRAQINRWLAVEKLFPRFAELYLKINQLKKRLAVSQGG